MFVCCISHVVVEPRNPPRYLKLCLRLATELASACTNALSSVTVQLSQYAGISAAWED